MTFLIVSLFLKDNVILRKITLHMKVSVKNKRYRSFNKILSTVGTISIAKIVDMKRREGQEVSAIERYKIAHFSKRKNKMINEEAENTLNELQGEEATSSYTAAEICLKRLNRIPGYVKGRSTSRSFYYRLRTGI